MWKTKQTEKNKNKNTHVEHCTSKNSLQKRTWITLKWFDVNRHALQEVLKERKWSQTEVTYYRKEKVIRKGNSKQMSVQVAIITTSYRIFPLSLLMCNLHAIKSNVLRIKFCGFWQVQWYNHISQPIYYFHHLRQVP